MPEQGRRLGKVQLLAVFLIWVYTLYGGKETTCNSKQDPIIATEAAKRLPSIFKFAEETFQNGGLHYSCWTDYLDMELEEDIIMKE
ncbi:hypothetical protein KY290_031020 [Solanum tuberosum]|nr:hypothetical protein KY290_031020 [Solanum tuberosum]